MAKYLAEDIIPDMKNWVERKVSKADVVDAYTTETDGKVYGAKYFNEVVGNLETVLTKYDTGSGV